AARLAGQDEPFSTQMYLPMPPARTTLANFFSPQVNAVEQMFLTGKPTYPVERTLLTSGLTAAGVESLWQDQQRIATPHLNITYQPTPHSTFWREERAHVVPASIHTKPAQPDTHSVPKLGTAREGLRLAVIATVYYLRSHAQHFCDRFLVGYPAAGHWHR